MCNPFCFISSLDEMQCNRGCCKQTLDYTNGFIKATSCARNDRFAVTTKSDTNRQLQNMPDIFCQPQSQKFALTNYFLVIN
jgi:hypothetical protein